MPLEAGKRDRMVWYAMHETIREALTALGWFDDPVANELDRQPVRMPWGGAGDDEPIEPNTIVVMPEDVDFTELETGSNSQRGDRVFVIDIYAEDNAVGLHLRGDISATLRGHLATVGRDQPILDVYDMDVATPYVAATMQIENVREERARGGTEPWERYWHSIMCVVEDNGWLPEDP